MGRWALRRKRRTATLRWSRTAAGGAAAPSALARRAPPARARSGGAGVCGLWAPAAIGAAWALPAAAAPRSQRAGCGQRVARHALHAATRRLRCAAGPLLLPLRPARFCGRMRRPSRQRERVLWVLEWRCAAMMTMCLQRWGWLQGWQGDAVWEGSQSASATCCGACTTPHHPAFAWPSIQPPPSPPCPAGPAGPV